MAGGPGIAAADGNEGLSTIAAQLVAADRGVGGIVPTQPDFAITRCGTEATRCQRQCHRRRVQRRCRPVA